jgi:hypothetical protein
LVVKLDLSLMLWKKIVLVNVYLLELLILIRFKIQCVHHQVWLLLRFIKP